MRPALRVSVGDCTRWGVKRCFDFPPFPLTNTRAIRSPCSLFELRLIVQMQLFCSHSHTRSLPFSHLLPNFRYTFTTPFHCSLIVFFVSAVSHMSNICPTSPYKDMGRYSSKEWKTKEKVTKYFFCVLVLYNVDDKISLIVFLFHARVYARAFQQRCWFFAVTSVTQRGNFDGKTDQFLEGGREIKMTFDSRSRCVFSLWNPNLLKYVQNTSQ